MKTTDKIMSHDEAITILSRALYHTWLRCNHQCDCNSFRDVIYGLTISLIHFDIDLYLLIRDDIKMLIEINQIKSDKIRLKLNKTKMH
jgi:hypothetical protein